MASVIPLLLFAVPCALGAWLWWSVRENGGKQAAKKPSQPPAQRKPSPYTMRGGEVALSFRVGNRYYDTTKNRVFECIALKGKKARLVAFGCLDSIERDLSVLEDGWGFNKVRTDGGVETCQRGALRADRQATEKEVAEEFDFLRRLRASG